MNHLRSLTRVCMSVVVSASVATVAASGADKSASKPVLPKLKESSSTSGLNVNELFRDGKALFDAGKFGDATLSFSKILKKFPDHQPTILLYARASYKINKLSEARYLFARVKPEILDAESAFEYGQSFYTANQYAPALMAFQKVPDNHPLSDLSRYYGGVSAIKLKQYELAEDLLTKALVLPQKEARSRASYLKHVGRLLDMQQKQALAVERANEKSMQQRELRVAKIGTPPVPSSDSGVSKGFEHKGFQSVSRNAKLGANWLNQTTVFGDSQPEVEGGEFSEEKRGFERQYLVSTDLGHAFLVGTTAQGRNSALGLQLKLKGADIYESGSSLQPFTFDTDNITRQQSTRTGGGTVQGSEIQAYIWFEQPIETDLWFYLRAGYEYVSIIKPSASEGKPLIQMGGGRKGSDSLELDGSLGYEQLFIDGGASAFNTIRAKASASYKWMPTLKSTLLGIHESFQYTAENIDGPSSSTRAKVSLDLSLPLESEISIAGTADYQTSNRVHKVVNFEQEVVEADGHIESGEIKFTTSPIPWWSLSVRSLINFATWSTVNQEMQNSYDRTVPYQTTESELTTSFNVTF
jgi:tetratricopeptide (TPR) repeat protein